MPVPTDRAIGLHQSLAAGLASGQGNLRAVRARRGLHCGGTRRDDRRPSTDRRSDAGRCRNTERTLSAGSDAGVLAMDPELLVLDEPMAGLNHSAQEDLLAVLGELHGRGIALLPATHDIDFTYRWADRFHLVTGGHCVASLDADKLADGGECLVGSWAAIARSRRATARTCCPRAGLGCGQAANDP